MASVLAAYIAASKQESVCVCVADDNSREDALKVRQGRATAAPAQPRYYPTIVDRANPVSRRRSDEISARVTPWPAAVDVRSTGSGDGGYGPDYCNCYGNEVTSYEAFLLLLLALGAYGAIAQVFGGRTGRRERRSLVKEGEDTKEKQEK
jgi:hypothetical protein